MDNYTVIIIAFISAIILIDFFLDILRRIRGVIDRRLDRKNFKENVIYVDKSNEFKYGDVDESELANFGIESLRLLKSGLYEIFLYFEYSYNNFDFNRMRLFCTDKLYNIYCANIDLYMKSGRKKIIEKMFRNKDVIVFEIRSDNKGLSVSTIIDVNYVSYTVSKSGLIISGSKSPINEKFEVIFYKEANQVLTNCVNCGAPISGDKCEFCNTVIPKSDFKISSIKKIIE